MGNGADDRREAIAKEAEARAHGFEPHACPECGNWTVVVRSPHFKCDTCGENLRMGTGGELEKMLNAESPAEDIDHIPQIQR